MSLPPKHVPKSKPPLASPREIAKAEQVVRALLPTELEKAIAVFAEEKRLNVILLQRRLDVTIVRANDLIEQMVKLLQERV